MAGFGGRRRRARRRWRRRWRVRRAEKGDAAAWEPVREERRRPAGGLG